LYLGRFWNFLVPWPLGQLIMVAFRKLRRKKAENGTEKKRVYPSSILLTFAIISYVFLWWFMKQHSDDLGHYATIASDGSKMLLSGAFLLGTILSVSVSVPGTTVIKYVIKKRPMGGVNFVIPFMWAFMWGLVGGILLAFFNIRIAQPYYQYVAVAFGVYGAFMELNAFAHVVRLYTIGLLLMGEEENRNKPKPEATRDRTN
jgi:hypothetical protein